jgi:hypothetical protein
LSRLDSSFPNAAHDEEGLGFMICGALFTFEQMVLSGDMSYAREEINKPQN